MDFALKNKVLALIFSLFSLVAFAGHGDENAEGGFNPGDLIMHHIADSHEWHIVGDFSIPLPVIIYSSEKGLDIFMSSAFHHADNGVYNGYKLEHDKVAAVDANGEVIENANFYDISLSKNVISMLLSVAILLLVFLSIASAYKKNHGKAPKGIQSFFEPIIIYIRDDVAKSIIGPKYEKFLPYLLTVFFFIWFNNLLGLFPAGANVTGNIAVTLVLALITFIITTVSANGNYWKHILWTPGVPLPLRIIILPIEIVGMFTKPFSLMIRLFANITAGHILILSLISLTFLFESVTVGIASALFATFMNLLELFVALLQAYVFTLLSAMYFAAAVEEHHHEEEHAH